LNLVEQPVLTEEKTVKRNPIIAFLFSILTPGLGQVYNGQPAKAAIFLSLIFLLPFLFGLFQLGTSFQGFCTIVFCELLLRIYVIIDALVFAVKQKDFKPNSYNRWPFYLVTALLILILFFIVDVSQLTGVKTFVIPTTGNEPRIQLNDRAVADMRAYEDCEPEYGDFVVFDRAGEFIVFPVVALPGDTLEIVNNKLVINGKACLYQLLRTEAAKDLPGGAKQKHIYEEILPNGIRHEIIQLDVQFDAQIANISPFVIPPGNYFVMGENRDNAFDSRYAGLVKKDQLAGELLFCYWGESSKRIGFDYRYNKQ
jgi:signal peptidase I